MRLIEVNKLVLFIDLFNGSNDSKRTVESALVKYKGHDRIKGVVYVDLDADEIVYLSTSDTVPEITFGTHPCGAAELRIIGEKASTEFRERYSARRLELIITTLGQVTQVPSECDIWRIETEMAGAEDFKRSFDPWNELDYDLGGIPHHEDRYYMDEGGEG